MSAPLLSLKHIEGLIRDVPDFPKPGILFKDITPLLADAQAFRSATLHLASLVPKDTTRLVAIESRGFILAAALAQHLGLGMVLIRKPGKLPYSALSHSYDLEYGRDTLQIHVDALTNDDRVCIVDDVLATGGTAQAAEVLCRESGALVLAFAFLLKVTVLGGDKKLRAPSSALINL